MTESNAGVFQITGWNEEAIKESPDGAKQTYAKITQSYSGIFEGDSELHYLMSYQSPSQATFVGHELLTGTMNGKSGSIVLQHSGVFENGKAKSDFIILSGSGKGEFIGLEGHGSFESGDNGKANYHVNIN
ncbi:DUF3224 domain-containing protein [Flocculibacter collagenilyticus]|uniref:DUF3224 domain-containing protein n=1 Tax=Flocculibacter collagenilyticus TaxID=2744479 RepID=UPI0018F7B8AA|nr:DUF3224 domain-containing protein [Flocculibacter collagenilyticus]